MKDPTAPPPTYCGLDIGSNTFSFTEIAVHGDDVEIVADESHVVRLSEDLQVGGRLKPAVVMRGLLCLEDLAARRNLKERPLAVVATAALRMTSAPEVFCEPAEEILGHPIRIIDGLTEARLVSEGAVVGLTPDQRPWIVVDVGGQSTEVCWKTVEGWSPVSLPVGVVGLTSRFFKDDPPGKEQIASMRDHVFRVVVDAIPQGLGGHVVGVAGTATTLAAMHLRLENWRRESVHGLKMSRESLQQWLDNILAVGAQGRTQRFGVSPGRADVFPAGLITMDVVLGHFGAHELTISANGLRVGAALSLQRKG